MLRYHPVIAFKKTDEIIKHIANCAEGQETYYSEEKKRKFDIDDNNCENFTNRCVLGNKYGTTRTTELNIEEQLNNTKSDLDENVDEAVVTKFLVP
ncbi:12953_t:CDS:2 [Ambispora gerdemannii]|uniref:12953_t:CDS:1 n=1 Tax=Ambispora gerdemannii TaxID=144530 RepID=A0A9N8VME8_9GLOM|nr:12953_t:CDS:2 [Ambispora gerdemannii]